MTREESIKRLDEQAFKELEEKRKMQEMKEKELIKEAVMIMHPKHKGVVMHDDYFVRIKHEIKE